MSQERDPPDHDRLSRMVRLSAPQASVWATIGGFGQIADWHPLIERVELTEIEGDRYRHMTTTSGEKIFDRLIETGPHHVTYAVEDGPFPISDCRATLSCVAEETGCHVYWSATFVPAEQGDHLPDEIVAKFFEIGLDALRRRFG